MRVSGPSSYPLPRKIFILPRKSLIFELKNGFAEADVKHLLSEADFLVMSVPLIDVIPPEENAGMESLDCHKGVAVFPFAERLMLARPCFLQRRRKQPDSFHSIPPRTLIPTPLWAR